MPIYEYKPKSGDCARCGGLFSDLQRVSDPAHRECPTCAQPCERIVSLPLAPVVRGGESRSDVRRVGDRDAAGALASPASIPADAGVGVNSGGHQHDCALHGCFANRSLK